MNKHRAGLENLWSCNQQLDPRNTSGWTNEGPQLHIGDSHALAAAAERSTREILAEEGDEDSHERQFDGFGEAGDKD